MKDPKTRRVIVTFKEHGSIHRERWDGTLGSLVLGLSTKRAQYEGLKLRQSAATTVLRAMKLLMLARIYAHTERRLRAVCAGVFRQRAIAHEDVVWQDAVDELLRLQFVRIFEHESASADAGSVTLVIRKDVYFDPRKVITDYPNPFEPRQLERHLAMLEPVLDELENLEALLSLGWRYYHYKDYRKATRSWTTRWRTVRTMQPPGSPRGPRWIGWVDLWRRWWPWTVRWRLIRKTWPPGPPREPY